MQTLETRRVLASIVVTTLADEVSDNGLVSLREAVATANDLVGVDQISFEPSLFPVAREIDLTLGQFEITESLSITGPGANLLTLDGQLSSRVIGFTADNDNLTLSGLTITRGSSALDDNVQFTASGGGIRFESEGTLTLRDVDMQGNSVSGLGSGGGAIFVSGNLEIFDSSFSSNNATNPNSPKGGAIFSTGGFVTIGGSSIVSNTVAGQNAVGGGLYAIPTAGTRLLIINSEITQNTSQGLSASAGGVGVRAVSYTHLTLPTKA